MIRRTKSGYPMGSRTWRLLACAAVLAAGCALAAVVQAQTVTDEGFYDLEELEQLLEVARESGFSDEELRAITIEDGGETINAWEYLQSRRAREAELAERERRRREKIYLTVQEIVQDLSAEREGELSRIRDESYYAE